MEELMPANSSKDILQRQQSLRLADELVFPIVGIGASAGGLEAFKQLLEALPIDTGLAFVIVSHLDPTHESILSDILAKATKMTVVQVKNDMPVKANHIYVVPPNLDMSLKGEILKLSPRQETNGLHMPIDSFFRSLAQNHGNRAIGIIFSGTGSDGALGLEEVKDRGGITFVQDPKTAKFSGMPQSAIKASTVDFVLSVKDIALELIKISHSPYISSSQAPPPDEEPLALDPIKQEHLGQIFQLLRQATGIDFTHYKHSTIFRRIARRMALKKIEAIEEYEIYLKNNPDELKFLYHDLLIKVTGFFRDPQTFEVLIQSVIPRILELHTPEKPIRIWVPGCASGEEVYSIAMCFLECLGNKATENSIRIFATDIDEIALQKARTGTYIENIATDVSPQRMQRFFSKIDHHYRINKSIRDMCTFSRHNLCKDPPFSNLDLISCRNVLIYFEPSLQKRVLDMFHYALNPQGFLTLGPAETIGAAADLFDQADKKQKIYTRKSGTSRQAINFISRELLSKETKNIPQGAPPMDASLWKENDLYKAADWVLLNQYAPAGVLINEQMDILQFRGDTGRYLTPSPGKASFHLLSMAREGLLSELTKAISQAKDSGVSVNTKNIELRYEEKNLYVTLKVIPLKLPEQLGRHFMVLFEEPALPPKRLTKKQAGKAAPAVAANLESGRLQQELQATKQYLQSIIENQDSTNEELKSANEELKSANEEILSSNEELQSTNEELETAREELQSTNEELTTVNEELQNRNLELMHANDDLNNLFGSSNISLIMVGRDLRIRRFTEAAKNTLQLNPTDIGKLVSEVKLNITVTDMDRKLLSVIETGNILELEIQDGQAHWYSMRIRPYKAAENKIEGAIILLIDIESLKSVEKLTRSLDELKIARDYSEGIVQTVREPLLILDAQLRVIRANPSFYKTFLTTKEETVGQFIYELGNKQWNIPRLRELLEQTLPKNAEVYDFEVEHTFPHIGQQAMCLNAKRIVLDGSGTETILLAIENITERKRSIAQTEIALKEKIILLDEIHHRVKNNLQIISSLLKLWPDTIKDPAVLKFFKESQDRIQAIALSHERLFASADLSEINMETYAQGLLANLLKSYPGSEKIDMKIHIEKVFVDADKAFACGLILNELISNIFKHAFPDKKPGQVIVELKTKPDHQIILGVQDNGVGMPDNFNIAKENSFGLHLVTQLVGQLGGHLDVDTSKGGTTFKIQFPSESSRKRPSTFAS